MTKEELQQKADEKLKRIIKRYGDDNGNRLTPWYYSEILNEVIAEENLKKAW